VKVLFYNHTGQISGGERVLMMILNGLDATRFDPVVACPADGPLTRGASDLGVRTLAIAPLAARFTWRPDHLVRYFGSFVRTLRAARELVRQEQPDLIHANSIRAGLVMSAATSGMRVPIVWHAHDLLPRHPLSSAIRVFVSLSRRNRIVAVSQAVADRFRGAAQRLATKRTPIITIHNAVDAEEFKPDHKARVVFRRLLGFAESDVLIGTVGQLTPRKGQLELIRAFASVAQETPHARLIVVGKALFNRDLEYAEALRDTAKTLGLSERIHFLGQREDVSVLMRAFDLAVVNSRAEPFGLTVVEAMASQTPLLATAVDGICEIVEHGKSGWLVMKDDHDDLVEGLRTMIVDDDLRNRLSAAALSEVRSRFSVEKFLSKIQSLYYQTLERNTSQRESARIFEVKLSAD
jgi:L-malate glycosyltransferase